MGITARSGSEFVGGDCHVFHARRLLALGLSDLRRPCGPSTIVANLRAGGGAAGPELTSSSARAASNNMAALTDQHAKIQAAAAENVQTLEGHRFGVRRTVSAFCISFCDDVASS